MSHGFCPRTALLAALLAVTAPLGAAAMDFKDSTERDVGSILDTLGLMGKFNILYSPTVSQLKMKLTFRELEPREAIDLVARMNNLAVREIPTGSPGAPPTLAVGRSEDLAQAFDAANIKVVRLSFARASTVSNALKLCLGKHCPVVIATDDATNALLLRGTAEILDKVESLIIDLDLPVPQMSFELEVIVRGALGSSTWSTRMELRNGYRVPFTASQGRAAADGAQPVLGKLSGWVQANCNKDHFMSVELNLAGTVDCLKVPVGFSLTQALQLRDSETRTIYTQNLGTGGSVSVRVKPVVIKQTEPPVATPARGAAPVAAPSPVPTDEAPDKLGPDSNKNGLLDL
jgi:hypothetical protein